MSTSATTVSRPSIVLLGSEPLRAALEYATLKVCGWRETRIAGDGHTVIVFPGLGTDGMAVAPLREYCASLGYVAVDWGRGYNTGPQGDVNIWMKELASHVLSLIEAHGKDASLVGWSLGGFYARELGKLLSPRVRQVITIGTPFNSEADHSNVGWLYRLLNGRQADMEPAFGRHLKTPPSVPTTSIYSRNDGIVAWQTCRHDDQRPYVEDVEIRGSHLGMGWNREVFDVVADRLAQRPGSWKPYSQKR